MYEVNYYNGRTPYANKYSTVVFDQKDCDAERDLFAIAKFLVILHAAAAAAAAAATTAFVLVTSRVSVSRDRSASVPAS